MKLKLPVVQHFEDSKVVQMSVSKRVVIYFHAAVAPFSVGVMELDIASFGIHVIVMPAPPIIMNQERKNQMIAVVIGVWCSS